MRLNSRPTRPLFLAPLTFAALVALTNGLPAQVSEQGIATSDNTPTASAIVSPMTPISATPISLYTQNATPLKEYQLREYMIVREREATPESSLLEVALTLEDFAVLPPRATYNFWIVGPTGTQPQFSLEGLDWAARRQDGVVEGPYTLEELGEYDAPPSGMTSIRATEVDNYRGVGLFRVEMTPVTTVSKPNGGGAFEIGFARRAMVRVNFSGMPASPTRDLAQRDPYLISNLSQLVKNPTMIPAVYQEPAAIENKERYDRWIETLQTAERRGLLLQAKLARGGVYTLEPEDLIQQGISVESINPDELRVFAGGDELGIYFTELNRGRFVGRSKALFYVPEDLADRKPHIPLWIMLGEEGTTGRRIEPDNNMLTSGIVAPASVTQKITVFKPEVYLHVLPLNAPQLRWATELIPQKSYAEYEFQAARPIEGTEALLRVWLTGSAANSIATADVFLNNIEVPKGSLEVRGARPVPLEVMVPTSMLREGTNTLSIKSRERENLLDSLTFIMAELEVPVSSHTVPMNERVVLRNNQPDTPIPVAFGRGRGFSGQAFLADITDPLSPKLARIDATSFSSEPTFRAFLRPPGTQTPVIAAIDSIALRPRNLEPVTVPTFHNLTAPVDYLIVTDSSLMDGAKQFATYRGKNFKTEIVTTTDLYNIYAFGEISYEAIHKGLRHAFRERDGARLSKVLLLGEASEYWWGNRHPGNNVSPNMLPVFGWRDPSVTIRGDDGYTHMVGRGVLPDVDLGRISVFNNEELTDVFNKVVAYETTPPPGAWRNRHLFVTDDEPEFDSVTAEILDKALRTPTIPVLMSLSQFPYEDYFRVFWRKRSVEMTEELIRRWGEGAATICYMGHGGPNLWSSERILHIRDVDNINVNGRFPILVAGSCDTGWIDYPVEPVQTSLAEHLLKNPIGGAVAAFIPIDGTSSFEHNFLISAFYDAFENRRIRDIGLVSSFSKVNYHLYRNNNRVTFQYTLLGDPALRAPGRPESIEFEITPEYSLPEDAATITVSAEVEENLPVLGEVHLLNPERRPVMTHRFRSISGSIEEEVQLPDFLPHGIYSVIVEVTNDARGFHRVGERALPIFPQDIVVNWTTDPPMDRPHPAGTPITVRVEVRNNTPREFRETTLIVTDRYTNERILNIPLELEPGGAFQRTFTVPLPEGINSFLGELYPQDPTGMEVAPLPLASSEFKLFSRIGDRAVVDVARGEVTTRAYARGDQEGHQVTIPVVALFPDEPVRDVIFRLALLENEERRVIAETPIGDEMQEGERRLFTLETSEPLPQGIVPVAFETVYRDEEGNETIVQLNLFEIDMISGGDLEILPETFILENERLVAGRTVYARVDVRNAGLSPLEGVNVQLRLEEPWIEGNVAPNSTPWSAPRPIGRLMPGETQTFRLRWDPMQNVAGNTIKLHAVATTSTPEKKIDNNVALREVVLERAPNLALDRDKVTFSQELVEARDVVRVTVPFHNRSDADFVQEFRIGVSAIRLNGSRDRVLIQRYPSLASGESGLLMFDWQVQPGQHTLEINLNEDREYLEFDHSDNVLRKTFPYIVTQADLRSDEEGSVLFDYALRWADAKSVIRLPGNVYTTTKENRTLVHRQVFNPEFVVQSRFGDQTFAVDNLAGRYPDNTMVIAESEEIDPIRFRIPTNPEFMTSEYEVVLNYFGRTTSHPRIGDFRVRMNNETDWRTENKQGPTTSLLGRETLRAGFVELEFKSGEQLLATHITGVDLYPTMGRLDAPVMKVSDLPNGLLQVDADQPGASRVEVLIRYGTGDKTGVLWGDWIRAQSGEPLPAAPSAASVFQWRAELYRDNDDTPALRSLRVVPVNGRQFAQGRNR